MDVPQEKHENTLWHEIITKIIPWELFFVIFEGFSALEMSREKRQNVQGKNDIFKELRVRYVIFRKYLFQNHFT